MEILISIIIVIIVLKVISNKMKEKLKVLINTVKPESVVLVDLVVLKYIKKNGKDKTIFMPVLKNNMTNKIYLPIKSGDYGNILISYTALIGQTPKVSLMNLKRENINFGTQGRLFIEQECGNIHVEGNKVIIENREYIYQGNFFNITGTPKNAMIYNITDNNILEILNDATLYKGVADFDMEGILKEHIK